MKRGHRRQTGRVARSGDAPWRAFRARQSRCRPGRGHHLRAKRTPSGFVLRPCPQACHATRHSHVTRQDSVSYRTSKTSWAIKSCLSRTLGQIVKRLSRIHGVNLRVHGVNPR
ncbi:MAG: hypothetical protein JST30_11020, partial [Armatimonadetes bacterium]|nr:hypothetical protein [Armatimonadota bacterium]